MKAGPPSIEIGSGDVRPFQLGGNGVLWSYGGQEYGWGGN